MSNATRFHTLSVKVHRYLGLLLAIFLILIAGTGSIIAFYDDLERSFNARMRVVTPQAGGWTIHDALAIREKLEAQDPRSHLFSLQFPQKADESLFSRVMPAINPDSGEPYAIDYDEVFANPYTGERLGQRIIGEATLQSSGLFSFIYYLHYALILPLGLGTLLMGSLGLAWALESMVGFYLTLPAKVKPAKTGRKPRSFVRRWSTSWKISAGAHGARRMLDIHRASGLWLWPLLLIFAVSGFALNLGGPYAGFVSRFVDYVHFQEKPPRDPLAQPLVRPPIDWFKAAELGQSYFRQQAKAQGFTLGKPASIDYRRDLGLYFFSMHTSRDLLDAQGNPTETNSPATTATIAIDARDGRFLGLQLPTGQRAGNTMTSWLMALHVTAIGGRPWQIAVSAFGLLVVTLSSTGLLLWWRRHNARRPGSRTARSPSGAGSRPAA
ncbi:PepSY-associated TM helix domain-containing protein [Sphingobium sp. HBC34]|uniref:PepSY-associated TM helix domain-containing protein n=1 Tax=Sphingobium cyanobacteriorum TaxID=3063954 RepID=A0ABT8ZLZ8_9SPHN|nr:PepSY-associated TM helix domain-containing protein [Sphingobium sp. HBC34]MDO7835572.1 PepSY-associated TM helix domain-containing protein [Sphingobium sp. HBC34]